MSKALFQRTKAPNERFVCKENRGLSGEERRGRSGEGSVQTEMTTSTAILLAALSASFAVVAGAKQHGVVDRPKGHLRKRRGGNDATRMAADKGRVDDNSAGKDRVVIRDEEIEFWSRLLQGSMPQPVPTTMRPQPSTPRPTNSLQPPTPVSGFKNSGIWALSRAKPI